MKKELLFILVVFLCSFSLLNAQQIIGSFPTMDGGFEGQASSGSLTGVTYATGSQSAVWTTSSNSLATFQTSSPRTGGKYINVNYTSTTKRLQSPTATADAINTTDKYVIQYYYRTAGATAPGGTTEQCGISTDGTNPLPSMSYTTITPAFTATNNTWQLFWDTCYGKSSTNPSPKYGYACPWRTSAAMATGMDVDDFCMYPGSALDVTPPDPVTALNKVVIDSNSVQISWTAPVSGVDGGGYMVVRGLSDPSAVPNVNGIYAVGNYVTPGQQVAYIGTNTSFLDSGLPTNHYFYRVYTVDKAFNYSSSVPTDALLPVELSSFFSTLQGRNVVLNWSTKTEKNSDKFEVERSLNLTWTTIGSVKASVLSNSPKQYSFTDKNLQAGKYQYRLKMIDNDGAFQYSKIVETEIALPKDFELSQNYPNPFNPSTQINYSLPSDSKVTLEVYNINGDRIVLLVDQNQSAGFYTVNFNNKNISSGVYFYHLVAVDKATGNNFSSVKKMMLLK